jgi:acyl carrier protein
MTLFEQVQQVVAGTLSIPAESVTMKTTQENLAAWDSLAHVNLVMALEQQFQIELEVEEFMELNSVETIVRYLEEAGID